MELDRTKIVIRQRSLLELADLTLTIVREYWGPLLVWTLIGALPFALLNLLVLYPMLQYEDLILTSSSMVDVEMLRLRYLFHACVLVFLECPMALQGLTFYLGEAVFVERPPWRSVLRYLRSSLVRCILVLGILRGGLLGLPALLAIPSQTSFSVGIEVFLVGFVLLGGSLAIRAFRPFAPEILMLERCPLFKGKEVDRVRYGQRSNWLHSAVAAVLFARMMFIAFVCFASVGALLMTEDFLMGVLFGTWNSGWVTEWIFMPLNCWIVAAFVTVFRFLSYLDTRIRLEGWEIQLRLKAEASRLEPAL